LKKLHEWLSDHPIVALVDKDFLGKVIAIRKAAFEKAAAKIAEDDTKLGAGNWVGKYLFLQVLHAIIDNEDNKRSFIRRADLPPFCVSVENQKFMVLSGPRLLRHGTIQISIQQPRLCQMSTLILLYKRLFLMNVLLMCQHLECHQLHRRNYGNLVCFSSQRKAQFAAVLYVMKDTQGQILQCS
jgi:hypothetical protein